MAFGPGSRLQNWLEKRDRNNQVQIDAMSPPAFPSGPAMVLEAISGVPDPAFAYRLQLVIDGRHVEGVPWGWSLHPLPLGKHVIDLYHWSGVIPRASRATVPLDLDRHHPVLHLVYQATALGLRGGRVTVEPYDAQGWEHMR